MSFLPAKHNFKIWIGGTWRYRFGWQVQEGGVTRPQDLTGYSGEMVITPVGNTQSSIIIESGVRSESRIVFGGESGLVDLIISSEETSLIEWKQAKFELKVKNALGEDLPLIVGLFTAQGPL